MQTVTTSALELMEGWIPSDAERARVRVNFPINASTGAESSAVVLVELGARNVREVVVAVQLVEGGGQALRRIGDRPPPVAVPSSTSSSSPASASQATPTVPRRSSTSSQARQRPRWGTSGGACPRATWQ